MRAVVITKHGGPEVLQVLDRPDPAGPGPGEVAVDVRAAGVNFADTMARVGFYPEAPKPPMVVGYEVAGVVSAVGDGVDAVTVGERVLAGTRFGGYAERVVVGERDVVPLDERLTFEQGAAIPVNYATAWAALVRYGSLLPGERVLLHAAAGGVGIAATQLARSIGAEVHGTASPGKHEAIRGFGVDVAHDYTKSGWHRDLPPFDLVMDAIGGASFRTSYDLLRPGGRLVAFGAASVMDGAGRNLLQAARTMLRMPRFNLVKQMSASKAVIGLNMLALWDDAGTLEPWITPLRTLIADGTVQPVVAESFPFDRAADAHRMIAERRNVGKVVLVP
ncbi:zinc-binding dehydrogenase [Nocardioides bizhenqiangii]|uniref:Zinc-binding dehydrogenase n=1 Tax=Nocardioides bizhenqiangii TaxID=3095076 RepID=A0ABZ0ZPP5_9ACTN|nr:MULTISPECIES: zinc-binding dehydrogenase [unclassified Nocardioides]MDZ5619653.1 zinc-binding dehydrogenase [Nocardioides sp. HM23]WQQ26336.1 zinc-binding dehydrogenase [Nocardioides sp. HM61]